MQRTHVTLCGILLVQLLLILFLRSPFSEASRGVEARALIPQLEAITATRLEVSDSGGENVTLVKQGAGWVIDGLAGFPADHDKVEELVEELGGIEVRRPVVSSGRYHASFKVREDDNEGRLKIWGGDSGEAAVDLILGSSANYRSLHVRRSDEDAVYEVRGLNTYDVRPDASIWAEKQLVDVAADDLVGLSLSNSGGSLELERSDGVWSVRTPESAQSASPDAGKLDALIQAASSIRIADPVGTVDEAAHGLSPAAATVILRYTRSAGDEAGEEGAVEPDAIETAEIRIGRPLDDDDTKRYITRSGFGYSGTIWESSVEKLIEQTVEDLLTSSVASQESLPDMATP